MARFQAGRKLYFNEFNILLDRAAYLPFASGLLRAYAQSRREINLHYDFMPFLFIREKINKVIKAYRSPAVAAFSVFMWNEQFSLQIAKLVKEKFPDCLIVFGGVQVPFAAERYLKEHAFIDIAVHGDGEETFSLILERNLVSNDFSGIHNISWKNRKTGEIQSNGLRSSVNKDLALYPSPYLAGIFDYLFNEDSGIQYQAIIETNRGCPFDCSYCVWGKGGLNKKLRYHSLARVKAEIDWIGKHKIRYLFNADANFGIGARDVEIASALAATKIKYGFPEKFRTCIAKHSDKRIQAIAAILSKYDLGKGITLSFQSIDQAVVKNIRRKNIQLSSYKKLLEKLNRDNIPVYTELILGLPGESEKTWISGLNAVIASGLKGQLFIYLCEVYPNTELFTASYRERFGIVTQKILLTETHGSARDNNNKVKEYHEIVVGTGNMPHKQWKKMLIFSWMTMLLFSLKLGYFILLYLGERFKVKPADFIGFICEGAMPEKCTILRNEIIAFEQHLKSIMAGKGKCVYLKEFGHIYWEAEEASYLRISEKIDEFYAEMLLTMKTFLQERKITFDENELEEVVRCQKSRIPSVKDFKGDKVRFAREILLWGRKSNKLLNEVEC